MDSDDEIIDFTSLEAELHEAIEQDAKYWRENSAKLRAVEQRVATYDEFRDIVKAAHLRPLEKAEKVNNIPAKKSSIWNSLAGTRKRLGTESETNATVQSCPLTMSQENDHQPLTPTDFVNRWRLLDICDRLALLKQIGPTNMGQLMKPEIPVGILGEILQALLAFPSNTEDVMLVVQLLEVLTEAKRFSLSLQFLSSVEKATCKQLMEKLNNSLQNRQQDLAEQGITEWTILELRKKYKV